MSTKIIKTLEQMSELLRNTDDETVILRDKGGYVWVSSGYTRDGIFLTLSQGPFDAGQPLSLQASKRLMDYGEFRVVFDTREDMETHNLDPAPQTWGAGVIVEENGAPQGEEMVTDPYDAPSYPWNTAASWSPEERERIAVKYDQARELLCEQQHLGLDFGAAALVVADLTNKAAELRKP